MRGFNYDVFSHVRVPKRKILINVLVDVVPNHDNKNPKVGNDGFDV